jgi:acetylornithine deacetylase
MTIEPFTPLVREGRIYGRGACDVKGSLAVIIQLVSRLVRERPPHMPHIVLAATVNEENGFSGARRLAQSWTQANSKLLTRPPDAALVAEPTQLDVVVAHKGVLRWRCHTRGQAAHSSSPAAGQNAIYAMARVLSALESYASQLPELGYRHPVVGPGSLSVGTIAGGTEVNTVPDHCTVEIDLRLLPEEDPQQAYANVIRYVGEAVEGADRVQHDPPYLEARGLADTVNAHLGERLIEAAAAAGVTSRAVGVPYATDAWAISDTGIPTVVFGPGSIEQAHTSDEWISVNQLQKAAAVLWEFCTRDDWTQTPQTKRCPG